MREFGFEVAVSIGLGADQLLEISIRATGDGSISSNTLRQMMLNDGDSPDIFDALPQDDSFIGFHSRGLFIVSISKHGLLDCG